MLTYIKPYSDLHLDGYARAGQKLWVPKGDPAADKKTALILAGDLWEGTRPLMHAEESWLSPLAARYRYIIIVPGNHDLWGETLNKFPTKFKNMLKDMHLNNVYLLDDEAVTLEGVKFVGGTLWTDFNKQDPFTMRRAQEYMNDYRYIRVLKGNQYVKLTSQDVLDAHRKTKAAIFNNAKKDENTRKIVCVTHHSPSFQSMHANYAHIGDSNGYYHSELGNEIVDTEIDYWIHGHVHNCNDYMIGNTRIISNPIGYYPYENTGYEMDFLITL